MTFIMLLTNIMPSTLQENKYNNILFKYILWDLTMLGPFLYSNLFVKLDKI